MYMTDYKENVSFNVHLGQWQHRNSNRRTQEEPFHVWMNRLSSQPSVYQSPNLQAKNTLPFLTWMQWYVVLVVW